MQKVLLIGWVGAYVLAALCYPVAWFLTRNAVEAYIISAKDKDTVDVERAIFEPPKGASKDSKEYRDAVMRIYGSQTDEPTKVVWVAPEKFRRPEELPSLILLPVDKQKGENPYQVKTVYFFATRSMLGFSVAGFVLVILWIILRRKSMAAAPKAAPPA